MKTRRKVEYAMVTLFLETWHIDEQVVKVKKRVEKITSKIEWIKNCRNGLEKTGVVEDKKGILSEEDKSLCK